MTAPRRWFRLDVTWSSSLWLAALRPGGRLAWVELLAYVKGSGVAGRVKALPTTSAARRWSIQARDIQALLDAATKNGALHSLDGDWVITGWAKYQDTDRTASDRMKRHRAKKGPGGGGSTPLRPVTRNRRNAERNPSRDRDVDVDVDPDVDVDQDSETPSPPPPVQQREGGRLRSNPEPQGNDTPNRTTLIREAEPIARLGLNRMRGRDDEGDVTITPKGGRPHLVGYGLDLTSWRMWAFTRTEDPAILARALWHVVDVVEDMSPPITMAFIEKNHAIVEQAVHRALNEEPSTFDVDAIMRAHQPSEAA